MIFFYLKKILRLNMLLKYTQLIALSYLANYVQLLEFYTCISMWQWNRAFTWRVYAAPYNNLSLSLSPSLSLYTSSDTMLFECVPDLILTLSKFTIKLLSLKQK